MYLPCKSAANNIERQYAPYAGKGVGKDNAAPDINPKPS